MSNHLDERTIAVQQRWGARGMLMLSIALTIDVLVRILILKQEPRQYLDISLIWVATNLYVAIGMTASGVEPLGGKWSKSWQFIVIIPIVVVVTTVVMLTLMGMIVSLADLIAMIVSCLAGVFLSFIVLRGIYGVWERRTLGRGPREE